eukprot:gene1466-12085_t
MSKASIFDSISGNSPNRDILEDFYKEENLEEDFETKLKLSNEFISKYSKSEINTEEIKLNSCKIEKYPQNKPEKTLVFFYDKLESINHLIQSLYEQKYEILYIDISKIDKNQLSEIQIFLQHHNENLTLISICDGCEYLFNIISGNTFKIHSIILISAVFSKEELNFEKFNIPVLLIHGKEDLKSSWKNVTNFYNSILSELKSVKLYSNASDLLFEEYCTKDLVDEIIQWLDELNEKLELLN